MAFSCQGTETYRDALAAISRNRDVHVAASVGDAVDRSAEAGDVVEVRDGHRNEAGHQLAGEQLLAYLRSEDPAPSR